VPIDDKGEGGATPLQFAVQGGKVETAKFLVRRGASLEQKNDAGQSALELVERSGDTRFLTDLVSAAKLRGN
jgi:ankyrin repeat protein